MYGPIQLASGGGFDEQFSRTILSFLKAPWMLTRTPKAPTCLPRLAEIESWK